MTRQRLFLVCVSHPPFLLALCCSLWQIIHVALGGFILPQQTGGLVDSAPSLTPMDGDARYSRLIPPTRSPALNLAFGRYRRHGPRRPCRRGCICLSRDRGGQRRSGPRLCILRSERWAPAHPRFDEPSAGAWLGESVAMGDVDGDGRADVAAGAPHESGSAGAVYVFSGDGTPCIDLRAPSPAVLVKRLL